MITYTLFVPDLNNLDNFPITIVAMKIAAAIAGIAKQSYCRGFHSVLFKSRYAIAPLFNNTKVISSANKRLVKPLKNYLGQLFDGWPHLAG